MYECQLLEQVILNADSLGTKQTLAVLTTRADLQTQ